MKVTEKRLKEIILEELQQEQENKIESDVEMISKYMSRINNVKEYEQMLTLLLKLDFGNDAQKTVVLRKMRDSLNKLLSAGKEGK